MAHGVARTPQREELSSGVLPSVTGVSGMYMNGRDSRSLAYSSSSSGTPTELWDNRSGEEDQVQRAVRQAIDNKTQQRLWNRRQASQPAQQNSDEFEVHRSDRPALSVPETEDHLENGHATKAAELMTVSVSMDNEMDYPCHYTGVRSSTSVCPQDEAGVSSGGAPEVFVDLSSFLPDSGSASNDVGHGFSSADNGTRVPFRRRSVDESGCPLPQRLFATPTSRQAADASSGVQSAVTRRPGGSRGRPQPRRQAALTRPTAKRRRLGGERPRDEASAVAVHLTMEDSAPLSRLLTRALTGAGKRGPQEGDYDIRTGRRRRKRGREAPADGTRRDESTPSGLPGSEHGEGLEDAGAVGLRGDDQRPRRRESLSEELMAQLRRAAGEEEEDEEERQPSVVADQSANEPARPLQTVSEQEDDPSIDPVVRPGGYASSFLRQRAVHVATGRPHETQSSASVASSTSSLSSSSPGRLRTLPRKPSARNSFQAQRKGDTVVLWEEDDDGATREHRFLALPAYDEHGRRQSDGVAASNSKGSISAAASVGGAPVSRTSPSRRAQARSSLSSLGLGLPPRTPTGTTPKGTPPNGAHGGLRGYGTARDSLRSPASTGVLNESSRHERIRGSLRQLNVPGSEVSGVGQEGGHNKAGISWRLKRVSTSSSPSTSSEKTGSSINHALGTLQHPEEAALAQPRVVNKSDDERALRLNQTLLLDTRAATAERDARQESAKRQQGGSRKISWPGVHRLRSDPTRQSVGYYDEDGEDLESAGVDEDVDEDDDEEEDEEEGHAALDSRRSRSIGSFASADLPESLNGESSSPVASAKHVPVPERPPRAPRDSRGSESPAPPPRSHVRAAIPRLHESVADHSRAASGDWGKDSLTGDEESENEEESISRATTGRASAVSETPYCSQLVSESEESVPESPPSRDKEQGQRTAGDHGGNAGADAGRQRDQEVGDGDVHAGATIANFPSRPPPGMAPVRRPWWQTLCGCCGADEAANAPTIGQN